MSSNLAEATPLLEDDCHQFLPGTPPTPVQYASEGPYLVKTYKRRFWILLIFSLMACLQCLEWNTWGPISQSAIDVFPGWSSATVAMLSNWGTITFVIFIFPMIYLTSKKGIRAGVLLCSLLMFCGTSLRCLTLETPAFTVLCHLCAILVGTPGTLVMAVPPLIASSWFPPHERTTATAFSQAFNQLGSVLSYLQPLFVRSPESNVPKEDIKQDIRNLMFATAGVSCLLFVCILMWFPSRPPLPPSFTSQTERSEFGVAIKSLLRNKRFIYILISYSVFIGVPSAWMSVLNFSFITFGIQQNEAMFIGVMAILSSCTSALVVGRFTDRFYGHVKVSLITLMIIAVGAFLWFLLLTVHLITPTKWQIYASVIIGVSANFASCPLFFEIGVEGAYPAPEVLVGGVLTCGNNLAGLLFLFLFLIPSNGYNWVTFCMFGGSLFSIFPMLHVKEEYCRSGIDRVQESSPSPACSMASSDGSSNSDVINGTGKLHQV